VYWIILVWVHTPRKIKNLNTCRILGNAVRVPSGALRESASCSSSKLGLNYLVSKVWDLKLFFGSSLIHHHDFVLCISCQALEFNDWMLLSPPPASFSIFCSVTHWVMKLIVDLQSLTQLLLSYISNNNYSPKFSFYFNLLETDFFFQILAHPVFKMWVIQKPNKVALWNKRHFEEKKWRLYSMFKIFSTDICWINIKWGI
jgi:hypothetical protein